MYEYQITFFDMAYYLDQRDIPLGDKDSPMDPKPESLYENPRYLENLRYMGQQGWELITVAPCERACYSVRAGYGYSLTAGYFLFWKRSL